MRIISASELSGHIRHCPRGTSSREGALLLEALLALSVIAAVMIPISEHLRQAAMVSKRSLENLEATMLCDLIITEQMLAVNEGVPIGFQSSPAYPDFRWRVEISRDTENDLPVLRAEVFRVDGNDCIDSLSAFWADSEPQ